MVEFESSALIAVPTASEEASVSSSGDQQLMILPAAPPVVATTAEKKKRNLPGMPDPDAEVIALSPKSLLATNRFVCEICSKGFQRDQNLQLHRRGHNLPWKLRQRTGTEVRKRVYVCPEPTCVHHDPKRALGDLTGIKKHFCRKHGEKKWKCERCAKKYAVQSDWKAHMKTCGTKEYRCDCGTLFSRRDSFITHRAFCDALAQESARSAEVLAIANPEGNLKIQTVAAASSSSPPPQPLTPSTGVLSPVLSIQSSEAPENLPVGLVQQQPGAVALTSTTTAAAGSSTTSGNTLNSNSGVFASIFASSSSAPAGLPQSSQSPSSYSGMICGMAGSEQYRTEQPMSLSLSSSLYLSDPNASSLFPTTSHEHHRAHQSPALSATALLQKAAQMGATGSGSSFLRGLGLELPSSENRTTTASATSMTHQWNNHIKTEGISMATGLGLGLPTDGPDLMMGPSSIYGNRPATLDLFGLGVGDGGASTAGFSALLTSMAGGGIDVAAAAAVFGGVNSNEESWEGGPSERKPSLL